MATAKPWNPMEDAYKNRNFNKYAKGPGAELDDNLQPGAMASGGKFQGEKRDDRFQLCLKNVPQDMSEKAVLNLCNNYGKVLNIKRTTKTPYVFVTFATLSDMERALEGFRRDKPQDIHADIAKHTASNLGNHTANSTKPSAGGNDRRSDRDRYSDSNSSGQPDMSKRTIKGPFTNPERKRLAERKPFVTEEDYQNSDLKIVDPDRQCLVERDMHDRDRNNSHESNEDTQGGRKMHTGRAYYKDSKETTDNLKKLSAASKGSYNAEKNEFFKECSQFDHVAEQIQYCNLCKNLADKICQRCGDYYCSLECQRKDWNRHRMFCFPMPELVDPVQIPSNQSVPTLNNSFENKTRNQPQHAADRENRPSPGQSKQFPRNMDNKHNSQQQHGGGDRDRNRPDNRLQLNNRSTGGYNNDSNNQENRKNAMNQNQNRTPREDTDRRNNTSFQNKSDHGRKSDHDNRTSSMSSNEKARKTPETQVAQTVAKKQPPRIVIADYPKSGSVVAITAAIRPNKVYIRSMAAEDNVEYVKTINLINNEARNAKTLEKMPKRSDLAIADFQGEGYYRVCVLNPESEDKIMVAYVDFGNVDVKKLSDLKEIPHELIALKRQALMLMLKGVDDFEPMEKIMEYMNTFVDATGKDLRLVYDEKIEKRPVEGELIEISTNENFNKTINAMRDIKPAALSDDPVMSQDIKVKVLPAGGKVTLVVLDTSLILTGAISCILETDLPEIEKMTAQFTDYVKNTKGPYTPRPQEICLVQYDDDCWYRAECIEVVGDQNPSVLFTDFGNLTTAHIDKIRKYPKELIIPCVTLTCLLAEMPEAINQPLADRLKELIPVNEKIIVDKVEVLDEQTNTIYLNDVVETLKKEKLV